MCTLFISEHTRYTQGTHKVYTRWHLGTTRFTSDAGWLQEHFLGKEDGLMGICKKEGGCRAYPASTC